MARGKLKEQLLPSLLDRLTDDDPLNRSIELRRIKIAHIEKELNALQQKTDQATDALRHELMKELGQERNQFNLLASSTSSLREIRACVMRDLDWLFNAHSYSPAEQLEDYPEAFRSVLNYGMPDLAGSTASGIDSRQLEKRIRQLIIDFEPRLIPKTLQVHLMSDESKMDDSALFFEIESEMWSDPVPVYLHLRTQMELETGSITVSDY